jgi:hypothetical protein
MSKVLLILLVMAAVLAYIGFRYRRELLAIYRFGRDIRQMLKAARAAQVGGASLDEPREKPSGKMARCAKCQTWLPEEKAIGIGSALYCSRECVETAAVNRA